MDILILIALTLINGVFAMSEISVISSRKFKLENAAKGGDKGAKKALELAENPTNFLSTVQIGITLIGILLGIYSGERLTAPTVVFLDKISFLAPYSKTIATPLVLLFTTFVSILLGELLPKRIGLSAPEAIASVVSRPMHLLSKLTSPFVWLLTTINDVVLRLLGIKSSHGGIITEEEIKSMLNESTESGEIREIEQDIVERVFALGDRKVGALMTHRSDLIWLDMDANADSVRESVNEEIHSYYPVADGDLDELVGVVSLKDLFRTIHTPDFDLKKMILEPIYVPVSSSAYKLLDDFRDQRMHYAFAVDEFGTLQGIITMDDLLDALVGDVSESSSDEYNMEQTSPTTWIADGQYPFFEFLRYFDLAAGEYSDAEFSTLGGLVIFRLDSMPKVGNSFDWEGYHFEVTAMDGRRLDKIRVTKRLGL